ncbi:efflux RND transporter periplasmic adaptor subunit [Clostridium lundense]|uniref:efflux RND transporter periplasmic adaptor subunit n=1 Tax=Clostridium lundense TaxID=319475 RepID=UPI00047F48F4|nr:efflux RND transporter periplasmic adaptor subunit [Clostridium lundense]
MECVKEDNQINRKKKIKKLTINFFVIMAALTFFSNTINNFFLPKVTVESPVSGSISKEINSLGVIEARESAKLYGESGKIVEEVNVKIGDKVTKGKILIRLKKEDLKSKLEEENIKYNQYNLELEKLKNEGIYKEKNLKRKVEETKEKMNSEIKNLDKTSKLVKEGYEAQVSLDKQVLVLSDAKRAYEQALDDYNNALNEQRNSIKKVEYDIQMEKNEINKINKDMSISSDISAPCDGVISELNVEKGQTVDGSKPIIIINNSSKGFQFRMSVDNANLKYIAKGDKINITMKSTEDKNVEGTIREIVNSPITKEGKKDDSKKDLLIDINMKNLIGGEEGDGFISKKISSSTIVIPNSAVNTDMDGSKFVFVLKEKNGVLGNQYSLKKFKISIGESDNANTAIRNGITQDDKVVIKVEDDKAVSDGSYVTIKN